ncbi:acyl-CoA dehydrogenase [bacterium M00.F.Ca.ET.228.01.1.1]|uniref:acyl-CoA dehydrogenase family protein n=1 Tax=Paraburkholderia phenoliruptrix TaxID=252970 RepID=UPI001092255C|nr:acyl-CoA dehydrogenase family protein [Paraburkholderia phenoliruptrix]TGP41463.1 acyl-CoA dehydrogenase [bacterium M00.F.Ca.ET.228.01.1.1]TGR98120.1 acyl-CoA dehydrogenase [bacterium M00.F.Ca.ET.191.01.1.1]TGU02311.1 acyl-CoA dehydrogenase [bacterium M00.F.Ca.ET.155.01.1.1]MBW0447107.1 acyl-CoA dehydrogenase family protein [Paraburkholderia phenoliruptrix]MBW9101510.1 acyl-CoA dehydrogenase family protein [Paraburkholderia phenoliruptrix]
MTDTNSSKDASRAQGISPLTVSLGFAKTIADIAATAAAREREHRLPHDEIAQLKALGFGALRLSPEQGGHGVSLGDLFVVARDLAAADSNIAHAFRNHLWQVETALRKKDHPFHAHVLRLAAQKKTVGLSFTESDVTAAGARPTKVMTRLEWDASRDVYIGSGEKVYATGNLYNDAFVGSAVESRMGRTVQYVLERGAGVSNDDDWNGFGQRLTGSGTARFRDVTVPAAHLYPLDPPRPDEAAPWGFTFHQVYLTNCIAGIVRRVALDAVEVLRTRSRNFYHGEAAQPADEPVLQSQLGRIRAYAASVEATADRAVAALQQAWDAYGTSGEYEATLAATLAASEGKVVIDDLAPQIASWLIDLGSGSVVSRFGALDRHWRNIKVIASHNPRLYKERLLGQHLLTGQLPPTGAFF